MKGFVQSLLTFLGCGALGYLAGKGMRFSGAQVLGLTAAGFLLLTWFSLSIGVQVFRLLEVRWFGLLLFAAVALLIGEAFYRGAPAPAFDCQPLSFPRLLSGAASFLLAVPYGVEILFGPSGRR